MSRARTIKPGFFLHEDLSTVSPLARLLFIGLWTLADRDGLLEDRPRRWKIELLPADDCNPAVLLDELISIGVIERTEHHVDGYNVLSIPKFMKHQRIHWKEPSILTKGVEPEKTGHEKGSSPLTRGRARERQKAEGRRQKAEGRRQKAEGRRQKAEGCGRFTPDALADLYAEVLPELPQPVRPLAPGVKAKVKAAIHRDGDDPAAWRAYFESIRERPYLMGQVKDWQANLLWLLGPENRAKVEAGAYQGNRNGPPTPRGTLSGMDYSKGFDDV